MLERLREQTFSSPRLSLLAAIILSLTGTTKNAIAQTVPEPLNLSQESYVSRNPNAIEMEKIRVAFLAFFETRVLPNLDQYVKDLEMRKKIRNLFALFKGNPRNLRWCAVTPAKDVTSDIGSGFCIRFDPAMTEKDGNYAEYTGRSRTVWIPKDFNAKDDVSMAALVHDIYHVLQYDEVARKVPSDRYSAFWDGQTGVVVVPEFESEAMAVALQALNAATGGNVQRRRESPDGNNKSLAGLFKDAAQVYYASPSAFTKWVADIYRRSAPGARFFKPDLENLMLLSR